MSHYAMFCQTALLKRPFANEQSFNPYSIHPAVIIDRAMSLGLTRLLREMSTRNISWGEKAVGA